MAFNAKEILKNKFWIVESEQGDRVGTLSVGEEHQYMYTSDDGTKFFKNIKQLKNKLGTEISWTSTESNIKSLDKDVNGFPTSCTPYNPMYDVKKKLPLFTKSVKSKSLYCAGYFIIKFDKGWVKSFCPKLITVERYTTKGPYKTEFEMKQELSRAN